MVAAAVALVVYIAAAFLPGDEAPRYGVFTSKESCERAVAETRESGVFVTDCVAVTFPAPRVAPNKGA
jgi:hypothetical protein